MCSPPKVSSPSVSIYLAPFPLYCPHTLPSGHHHSVVCVCEFLLVSSFVAFSFIPHIWVKSYDSGLFPSERQRDIKMVILHIYFCSPLEMHSLLTLMSNSRVSYSTRPSQNGFFPPLNPSGFQSCSYSWILSYTLLYNLLYCQVIVSFQQDHKLFKCRNNVSYSQISPRTRIMWSV